jgi:thiol-disulfide isomerase/thioredoxin
MAKKKNHKIKQETVTKIIAGAVVGLLIIASIVIQIIGTNNNNTSKEASNNDATGDWKSALKSDGYQVFYLGRPSCSWCNKLRPYFNYVVDKYDVTYTYINTDKTTGSSLDEVFEALDIDSDSFGTPYIVIMKDGKKVNEQVGYVEESVLFNFFQDNGVISGNVSYSASGITADDESENNEEEIPEEDDSAYTSLTFIDYAKFEDLFNSNETSIIVVGKAGCGYCSMYKPVINGIAKDNGIKINYIDYLAITYDERTTLFSSLNVDLEEFGTPTTFIVKGKEVIDSLVGYTEEDETIKFYKENGILK